MDRRKFLAIAGVSPLMATKLFGVNDGFYFSKNKQNIFIENNEWDTFVSARNRLRRVKRYVGFGNFNIISFDQALYYAKNYSKIGAFTKAELELLDKLFYQDPSIYGFYGEKTCQNITEKISTRDVYKVPRTGHYLFKGKSLDDYNRLKKDVGKDIILTSGVRSVVKQMSLYLDKIYSLKGNISKASTSIAPPAYSYHSLSDFDVGKKGFGYANFTPKFATTEEFKSLTKLDYISMRYTINNKDGVRYEPWHIKII
jgi:hypothetical protein